MRSESLQDFLDAARDAFDVHVDNPEARASLGRIFTALEAPGQEADTGGARIPACTHLPRLPIRPNSPTRPSAASS